MGTPGRSVKYADLAIKVYEDVNERSSGWLAVLARALLNFSRKRASLAAAGITFFSIFSIFPLLVFTFTALKPFIELAVVQDALIDWLGNSFPVSLVFLLDQVNSLLAANESINIIALLGFLWSASGMFNAILVNINYAWGIETVRSKLKSRLIALALVTALAAIIVLLLILVWLGRLVTGLLFNFEERLVVLSLPLLFQLLLLYALYKTGPSTRVDGRAALIGTLAATLAIELTTWAFTWYLNSGWSSYKLFYGSLGAIIGLLFWVYLNNLIILFGAYLTEAIQTRWKSEDPSRFRQSILPELTP